MTAHSIAQKFRRALRHRGGCAFSYDQLVELAAMGVLDLLSKAENAELCANAGVAPLASGDDHASAPVALPLAPVAKAGRRGGLSTAELSKGL